MRWFTYIAVGTASLLGACAGTQKGNDYSWLDGLPPEQYTYALNYMDLHADEISNKDVITFIDYGKSSAEKRLYVVDLKNHAVKTMRVAHGKNSDPDNDGYLDQFGNKDGSLMSPNGFFRVGEQYTGKWGHALRVDGLGYANRTARERAVVIHAAQYVKDSWIKPGRSWGCPAVSPQEMPYLYSELPGSLLYIFASPRHVEEKPHRFFAFHKDDSLDKDDKFGAQTVANKKSSLFSASLAANGS